MKAIDMKILTTLLPISLLAVATASFGQATGGTSAPGAAQGRGAQQRPTLNYDFNDHEGWTSLFDGSSLKGWDGNKNVWRVKDGMIVGESTVENPSIWWVTPSDTGTAWLILNGKLKNFVFKAEIKLGTDTTNSGIQFRATRLGAIPDAAYAAQLKKHFGDGGPAVRPNNTAWENRGYQGDFTWNPNGNLIDCCMGAQRGVGQTVRDDTNPLPPRREGTAPRGSFVLSGPDGGKPELIATIQDPGVLAGFFKIGEWNQLEIVANGNVLAYVVNGHLMSVWIDNNQKLANPEGELALQLEGGGHTEVEFRNLWLKTLP